MNKLKYNGTIGELYGIWLINLLLNIITLGIYSFWGKTRMRKYLVGSISLLEDRFEYTGKGKELFIGFLKALPIIIILYSPIIIWEPHTHPQVNLIFIPILFLFFVGYYAALRYRYSRITWRGIRGKLKGSAWAYGWLRFWTAAVNFLTLWIISPHIDIKVQRYIFDNSYFGSQRFGFNPDPSKLMKIHIITLILAIFTLGFSRVWYRAEYLKHVYGATTIGNIELEGSQTGGNLLGLVLVNFIIALLTFGLGMPIIIQRNMEYFVNTLTFKGDINALAVSQSSEVVSKSGEGLDAALGEHDMGFM